VETPSKVLFTGASHAARIANAELDHNTLRETHLDLGRYPGYSYEKTEDLLKSFDKHVSEARKAIADSSDEDAGIRRGASQAGRATYSLKE
jgi:hypothetical protein